MADITVTQIKRLRDMTGAGMLDCKSALEASEGDLDKAVLNLREKGKAKVAKRAGRETANGVIEAYLHRTGDFPPQQGAIVELDCESDFVAKAEDFRQLAKDLAMHITAANPRWLRVEDVPGDVVSEEKTVYRTKAEQEGKPEAALERIVEGQLGAFYKDNVLLEQAWIREPKTSIKDLIEATGAKVQENITVRRFSRFSVKEG
ncbi:MAG TPA: translation elongation factor Ts [Candidatus Dormibacteraeota bacterium]|nr:translation elongation factor Ts [Candidatus Dormibacteraeota bacterium]